jgi:hypothetical protein
MARRDVLAEYPIARTTDDLVSLYRPLAEDLRADYVSVQVASVDAARAIRLAGEELLPELRS